MTAKTNCPKCKGTGLRVLLSPYVETMNLFKGEHKRTAVEVAARLKIDKTAAMMRLARLRSWGLLDATEQGGKLGRLYFKIK